MKRAIPILLLLLSATAVFGQGSQRKDRVQAINGRAMGGQQITTCAYSSGSYNAGVYTGPVPCTPAIQVYADVALSVPIVAPLKTDSQGNFAYWVSPQNLTECVTGPNVTGTCYAITNPCNPFSSISGCAAGVNILPLVNNWGAVNNFNFGLTTFGNPVAGFPGVWTIGHCPLVSGTSPLAFVDSGSCTGGGGSGTVVSTPQFQLFAQPNSGSSATAQGVAGITTDATGNNLNVAGNFSLTGNVITPLNATDNGAAGNVAVKNGATDGVCYASTNGNDSNDGLSWGSAKLTVRGCLVSLPGGSSTTAGKGTIYFTDGTASNTTSGAGLWLMGSTDPNYASPPAGWLKNPGGGVGISIIGVAKGNYGTGPTAPKAQLGGGNNADINHPCIWISGVQTQMRFENLQCNFQGRPIVVGEDSNHGRGGTTGGSGGITFVNVGASPNTVIGQGPAWDIVGGSFWLNFFYCFGQGTAQVNTPTANVAQAFLFDGTGNDGIGEIYLDHISVTGGGIKVIPGTVNPSVQMFEADHVEGESLYSPALLWFTGQMGAAAAHDIVANDSIGTLCNGGVCAIRNDGSVADNLAVSGALLGSALPPVLGPMVEVGGAFDLVGQPGVTASFLRQGLRGVIGSNLIGTSDVSRRQFGPTRVRFANTALSPASYIVIPGTTLTQNVADPSGNTLATRLTATGPGEGVYVASQSGTATNVGDGFIFGAWVHSFTGNGYATSGNPLSIGLTSCSVTFNNYPGFVQTPMPPFGGDGNWQWVVAAVQIATVSGSPCQPNINASADATHTLDIFGPVYFHIPVASMPSANEFLEIANNLQSYSNTCAVGAICDAAGTSFGGTGTVTHIPGALTLGESVIGNGSADTRVTTAYLDCSAFSGADWGLIAQACRSALNTINSTAGVADMRGVASGGTPASVNPESGTGPASGSILLGPGTYTTNVPIVDANKTSIIGESLVNDTSGNGTAIQPGAGFQTTPYTTGTISVGTAGASDVITGVGTTWTSAMVGCEFYGANGANNSTFGIIGSVGSTTSLTLNWGANNGSGAANGSTYTIACALHAHGGGASSSAGDQAGMTLQNIGLNCNNQNIIGDLNWYGNQGTFDSNVYITGCNSIGLDLEFQYQQSGPWGPLNINPGASCAPNTLNIVVRGNLQSFYGFKGVSQGKGACGTSPTQGIDVGATGANFSFVDNEQLALGLGIAMAPTCAVSCAMPPAAVGNLSIDHAWTSGGTTLVRIGTGIGSPNSIKLSNLQQSGSTNAVIDSVNGCTITDSRVTDYSIGMAGAILSNSQAAPSSACAVVLPNGTTATTQTVGDNSTKVATDAFVIANAGGGGGGGSPGGSTDAIQYNAGGGTFGGVNSPTANGNYSVVYNVTGSAAVAPTISLPGVTVASSGSATPSIAQSNLAGTFLSTNNTTSTAVTVPSGSGLSAGFVFAHCNTGSVVATDTPTTSTVNGNATIKLQGNVVNPSCALWWTDPSFNYWSAVILPTDANGRLSAAGAPAFTGDATNSAGSLAVTVSGINGTAFAGTNGHIVSFGAANIPADSGLVVANTPQQASNGAANQVATYTGANKNLVPGVVTLAMLTSAIQSTTVNGVLCTLGSTCSITSAIVFPATITGGTSGGVPYFSNTTTLSSSALLATGALVVGGGAGGAPATGNADFTYATHTLASAAAGILDLHLAATTGILFPGGFSTGILGVTASTGAISSTATTGTGSVVQATSPTLVTPALGAATATSLLASGIVDGKAPITVTTGTSATLGAATYQSGYTFNQEATAATTVTYTLPATATGAQYCVANSIVSGSGAPDTGVLKVYPPASSYVILAGVINTIGGGGTHGVQSTGAAGDAACFVAIDATHWTVYVQSGTWSAN